MKRQAVLSVGLFCAVAGCGGDASGRIQVPDGVRVSTVATNAGRPSNITLDRRGVMWTTSAGYSPNASDGVWRTRRGGRPRQITRLPTPLGLTWFRGELYVTHSKGRVGGVVAYSRFDGQRFRRRRTVLRRLPIGRHQVDSIVPGPDGRLYFGVGSVSNSRRGPNPRSATVLSVLPSGRGLRIEARGLRNPYGLAFIPGTRYLLVSENGRDDLGLDRPPEELNLVNTRRRRPASYGFPGCWEQGGRACRGTVRALARLAPHSAVAGVAVARRFGRYGLSAFVAEYGSSFDRKPTGGQVVRVSLRRRGGRWVARVRRFARGVGFRDPVGAAIGPDGALYVTLQRSGKILRFSARPPVQRSSTMS